MNHCKITLPQPGENEIKFQNYRNKLKVRFVVYSDCEAILKPVIEKDDVARTHILQEHEVFSIGYYVKCSYDDFMSYYKSKRGPDAVKWFVNELKDLAGEVQAIYDNVVPMKQLTKKQEEDFKKAILCHICELPLGETIRV